MQIQAGGWTARQIELWLAAMRPSLLDPFFAAITTLPGVGPKVEKLFRRLLGRDDIPRAIDLLFHLPTGTIDRRARPKLRDVVHGSVATVEVTIDRHRPSPPNRPRVPYLIYASDETGDLVITYFHARADNLQKLFPVGEKRYVSGTTALYDGMLQMVHPDRVVDEKGLASLADGRAGLSADRRPLSQSGPQGDGRGARQNSGAAGMAGRGLADAQSFPSSRDAMLTLHRPQEPTDIAPQGPAWTRLAYDELLAEPDRARACARASEAAIRDAAAPATAVCARTSSPPCPIR